MAGVPGPGAADPPSASLADAIRERIRASGPMTFAQFMRAALYDPGGFYARLSVGPRGDFVTSPHVSEAFGSLVACQVEEFWRLLGRPRPFTVIELGAGDGTLATQILEALPSDARASIDYVAVEIGAIARRELQARGLRVVEHLRQIAGPVSGCVIANEVLDNVPFHRLRGTQTGPVELYVSLHDNAFTLTEGEMSSEDLVESAAGLDPGQERVVRPSAIRLLDEAVALLRPGYVWVVDYGTADPHRGGGPVHGYRGHRVEPDVLMDPGSRDITAGVDFSGLAEHARARRLAVWGPVRQREVLLRLGFRELEARARARQVEAIDAGRGIDAVRIYSGRHRANLLLAQPGLGDFLVLCVGVGIDNEPSSMRALEERDAT